MSLGERIRKCRQESHLSQEKLAELVGVTRQAVTKWEADQSAPNTDNLFRLAEIFGTTVDLLLTTDEKENRSMIEEVYAVIKQEQERQAKSRRQKWKQRLLQSLTVMGMYLVIYLIGRVIWCRDSSNTVLGFLFLAWPTGEHSYLYGWLLTSHLFWWTMAISIAAALFGRFRLALSTIAGFVAGLILGILFGPYPAGVPYGQGDYGWAIWGAAYLVSIAAGLIWERQKKAGTP